MHYVKTGSVVRLFKEDDLGITSILDTNTYILKMNEQSGEFYLEVSDPYIIEHKVYGDVEKRATRIMNSFDEKKGNMGVLLVGTKGSGKTLLSKFLSMKAHKINMPTIIINVKHSGEGFLSFINSINTPCVIVFDEFDKVYKKHANEQRDLLTILDGVYVSRHLYVFTANDLYEIDSFLLNRPGRVYYKFEYIGLEEAFVRAYCEDNLKNKDEIDAIVNISNMFQALVEEMNRYDEPADEAVKWLNISPSGEMSTFDIAVWREKDGVKLDNFYPKSFDNCDIMNQKQKRYVEITSPSSKSNEIDFEDDDGLTIWLDGSQITEYAPDFSSFTYSAEGYRIVLKKRAQMKYAFGPF